MTPRVHPELRVRTTHPWSWAETFDDHAQFVRNRMQTATFAEFLRDAGVTEQVIATLVENFHHVVAYHDIVCGGSLESYLRYREVRPGDGINLRRNDPVDDDAICAAVDAFMRTGLGKTAACQLVSQMKEFGGGRRRAGTIRKRYNAAKRAGCAVRRAG